MAIKSTDQITILDVTDGYSVILTSEAYTFVGDTSSAAAGLSCSTTVVAYCGSNQCSNILVNQADITCPTGISATVSNSGTANPTITFKTTAKLSSACEATIPVIIGDVTINKKFSFAVARQGATGAKGDTGATGEDAITLTITTSNGTIFKNNSGSTVLTAHIFKGSVEQEITDAGVVENSLGTIKWYKGSSEEAIATAKTLTVSASDVDTAAIYVAQLE